MHTCVQQPEHTRILSITRYCSAHFLDDAAINAKGAFRYNVVMKLLFITVTLTVINLMRLRPSVRETYDKARDSVRSEALVLASLGLACVFRGPAPNVNLMFKTNNVVFTVMQVRFLMFLCIYIYLLKLFYVALAAADALGCPVHRLHASPLGAEVHAPRLARFLLGYIHMYM